MVFPTVMYGCESWTIQKAECQRIDAFELWCWRRLLRVPWTAEIQPVYHKGNQSWIFIRSTDAEAEAPILWPPDAKNWLTGKDPDTGKDWRWEEKGMTEVEGITKWMDMSLSTLRKLEMNREAWHAAVHGVAKSQTWLSDWTGPIPSPGNLPDPGIEPGSPALQEDSLPAELPGKPPKSLVC